MHKAFLARVADLNLNNQAYATAIIVRRKIPSSGKPGDKAIITPDGQMVGWIGGGGIQGIVLQEALLALADHKPRLVHIAPALKATVDDYTKVYTTKGADLGEVEVYIEPVLPKPQLLIFGNSHIAMALAQLAKAMDYRVQVVLSGADDSGFPTADSIIPLEAFAPHDREINPYVVVCTQGERDAEALQKALNIKSSYLAFVASRKRARAIYTELGEMGITSDQLKHVKMPAGLNIGAKTPQEVGISILAEIIQDFRADQEQGSPADKVAAIMLAQGYYKDPVCQVPVLKSAAKHVVEYNGEKVYCCSESCKMSFEKAQGRYV